MRVINSKMKAIQIKNLFLQNQMRDEEMRERRHTGGGTKLIQHQGKAARANHDSHDHVGQAEAAAGKVLQVRGRTLERSPSTGASRNRPQVQIVNSQTNNRYS